MFPEEFKQRISVQDYIDAEALLRALGEPSPVSIRINQAKWNRKAVDSKPVPWCHNGYYLESRPSYTGDPLFHAGSYYPQEASGMFLEQVILQAAGSLENINVLDLCAAPGGKSTLLSDLIGKNSLLVTNDVIRSRAQILAETVTKWGSANTLVTQSDPAFFSGLTGFFDIILVDAPCSGEGMFRTEIAVAEWSADNTAHCAERQKRILMDVWPALKENGLLIYSTCTFNPGENEENIKWLTGRNEAECIRLDLKSFEGITEIDFQGICGYGFYPDKVRGEGFFISAIRKKSSQLTEKQNIRMLKELQPGKSDLEVAAAWTDFSADRILKWGEEIIGVPCDMNIYSYLFKNLKIVKAGTRIAVLKKQDALPFHELALSIRLKKDAFPYHELSPDEAISYLRRDNFSVGNIPKGWNIVTYNSVNLGFIKNLGNRLNNYFPVEWRIRLDASALRQANPISWVEESFG
jgi:16S rRNA C967 or C1407 C5-methylase (RsmB/RsmF family)/NOL1/NOP2/fmu family ribosome biogenesis protein